MKNITKVQSKLDECITVDSSGNTKLRIVQSVSGTTDNFLSLDSNGNIQDSGYSTLDEDDMASDSATALATQQSIKAYADNNFIGDVVDDTTPQLGGDLDLNGKNIDFPTTANISDCLDEDDMASDSATALATQQSIKAYVDNNSGGAVYKCIYLRGNAYTDTAIVTILAPFAGTVTDVGAYACTTAPTGAAWQADININGTSCLSTKLEIDATTNADDGNRVIDTANDDFSKDDRITIDIDQVGSTEPGEDIAIYITLTPS